jgi:S-DNA-T family DNA segregation ATPase FtsK/SpoIIIE
MKLLSRIKKEHWKEPLGVLMILFAIWMLVSFAGYGGKVGDVLHENLTYGIGYISYLLAFIIGYWGVSLFTSMKVGILPGVFGSVCLLISGLMLLGLFTSEMQSSVGILGEGLDTLCKRLIGSPGLFLAGLAFLLIGITLSTELTFKTIFRSIYRVFRRPFAAGKVEKKPVSVERKKREKVMEEPLADQERPIVVFDDLEKKAEDGTYLRKPDTVRPYIVPPLSLLDRTAPPDEELAKDMLQGTARTLERSFDDFNIDARVLRVNRGPVITRYEVEPGPGVKVSKFVNLSDDLALVLRATRVRVVAPVPGQGVIGIEVPNERIAQVGLREVLESQEFRNTKAKLPLPLGKDISGKPVVVDLAEMPHLLIAGTTGSGKSVFLNSMIASMLFRMTPDELRILMVDPKRVELNRYNKIPHLLAPVVIDIERTPAYLKWALREVEKRYKRLANLGVRNIESYNRYIEEHPEVIGKTIEEDNITHGKLPFVVIIIDELADLMLSASAEVEASITRLAQIARAAGVHMLVSTQRPSVNVITGSIKANLPCRLSFRLASKVDSRTILDMNGAENLLGKGDMLFLDMNAAKPVRIQGCFVSEVEIERLVDFIKQHVPRRETEIDHIEPEEPSEDDQDDSYRELYNESVRLVLRHQIASTSFLQRRLNVSYERALQLLGDMEAEGVVGPNIGDEPREILIDRRND